MARASAVTQGQIDLFGGIHTAPTGLRAKTTRTKKRTLDIIHHHVVMDDRIHGCHGTLSAALHERGRLLREGNDDVSVESYAGDNECERRDAMRRTAL